MTPHGAIFLGDVLTAFARLHPQDDDGRNAIGRMMGFIVENNVPDIKDEGGGKLLPENLEDDNLKKEPFLKEKKPELKIKELPKGPVKKTAVKKSVELHQERNTLPDESENTLAFSIKDNWQVFTPFQDEDDLFNPIWQRQILVAMSGIVSPLGPVAITPLVGAIARGEPIRHLPRLPRWSLREGIQLMLDTSSAMLPYTYDQHRLLLAMKRLVGSSRVDIWRFQNIPWPQVRRGPGHPWQSYAPPLPGTPVVVVSRMGASCEGEMSELWENGWLKIANRLRRNGNPLVILTPYSEERVFLALRKIATVVHWDRSATVGGVLRQRRRQSTSFNWEREICRE